MVSDVEDVSILIFVGSFFCVSQKLNEHAAALFETGEETEVNTGLSIMNELVVTCIPLLLVDEMEEKRHGGCRRHEEPMVLIPGARKWSVSLGGGNFNYILRVTINSILNLEIKF